jgi:hypothetical protein
MQEIATVSMADPDGGINLVVLNAKGFLMNDHQMEALQNSHQPRKLCFFLSNNTTLHFRMRCLLVFGERTRDRGVLHLPRDFVCFDYVSADLLQQIAALRLMVRVLAVCLLGKDDRSAFRPSLQVR